MHRKLAPASHFVINDLISVVPFAEPAPRFYVALAHIVQVA
jgi:hypothetical protein